MPVKHYYWLDLVVQLGRSRSMTQILLTSSQRPQQLTVFNLPKVLCESFHSWRLELQDKSDDCNERVQLPVCTRHYVCIKKETGDETEVF